MGLTVPPSLLTRASTPRREDPRTQGSPSVMRRIVDCARALRGDMLTTAALIGGTNPEANNEADRQAYQAYDFHCSYSLQAAGSIQRERARRW